MPPPMKNEKVWRRHRRASRHKREFGDMNLDAGVQHGKPQPMAAKASACTGYARTGSDDEPGPPRKRAAGRHDHFWPNAQRSNCRTLSE